MRWYETFWAAVGGRKNFNTYVGIATLCWFATLSAAPFREFAIFICIVLGVKGTLNVSQKVLAGNSEQFKLESKEKESAGGGA